MAKTPKPQKTWAEYSDPYRKRMQRHGITSRNYRTKASRAKMQEVRGHKTTPEKPDRARRNPSKYPDYVNRQAQKDPGKLDRDVADRHRRFFASRIGYSRKRGPLMDGATPETKSAFMRMNESKAEEAASLVGQASLRKIDQVEIDGVEYDVVDWEWLLYH